MRRRGRKEFRSLKWREYLGQAISRRTANEINLQYLFDNSFALAINIICKWLRIFARLFRAISNAFYTRPVTWLGRSGRSVNHLSLAWLLRSCLSIRMSVSVAVSLAVPVCLNRSESHTPWCVLFCLHTSDLVNPLSIQFAVSLAHISPHRFRSIFLCISFFFTTGFSNCI